MLSHSLFSAVVSDRANDIKAVEKELFSNIHSYCILASR